MTREEIIARLKAAEAEIRAHGVRALYLFGSYARDEARPDSDVDLFVDKAEGRPFGFDELVGGIDAVERALPGVEVSYGTRDGLSKYVRRAVEDEALRIF